jgi:predicted transcriptional regulator
MSYETDLIDAMYDLDMIVRVYARKSGAYADEVAVLSYSSAYVQSLIGRIMAERCGQKVSIASIRSVSYETDLIDAMLTFCPHRSAMIRPIKDWTYADE